MSGIDGPIVMKFLCRSPVAVAQSFSGSIAIRLVVMGRTAIVALRYWGGV